MLAALGIIGIVAAFAARRGTPVWVRVLLGTTLLIEALATFVLVYWPHGTVVGLSLQAIVLAAWAPRPESRAEEE